MSKKSTSKSNPIVDYFMSAWEELRKVTWPTKEQTARITIVTLVFTLVTAILLGVIDFVFGIGIRSLVDAL